MSDCVFYKSETVHLTNPELWSDYQTAAPTTFHKAWCTHKHTPCRKGICGGASLLTCNGISTECTIPKELFPDFQ